MPKTAKEAYILCKINHITDAKIVQKLYEASAAGVSIRLLVRGNCSLVAGLGRKAIASKSAASSTVTWNTRAS